LPKRVVLIGHPVAQSLSGVLQQAAFDELGIDARYEPLDTPLIDLPDTIEACAATTTWAPTSPSPTRSGWCRWSIA
jgi:shikimate 5-dehydrogenase